MIFILCQQFLEHVLFILIFYSTHFIIKKTRKGFYEYSMKNPNTKQIKKLENRNKIVTAAIELIKKEGINSITVRSVCNEAGIATGTFYYYFKNKDDLLLSFIMESSFDDFVLKTPVSDIAKRITELYLILIHKYISFGKEFMKSFYSTSNTALSAYMSESNGKFYPGTIMARCEKELQDAVEANILNSTIDIHLLSVDICTIIKGIIFEYCLSNQDFDIESLTERMITNYFKFAINH